MRESQHNIKLNARDIVFVNLIETCNAMLTPNGFSFRPTMTHIQVLYGTLDILVVMAGHHHHGILGPGPAIEAVSSCGEEDCFLTRRSKESPEKLIATIKSGGKVSH